MTSYLDRLNLRPFEKRLVVGVAAVLFVVFNAWFVFPHFSDLAKAQDRKADALKKLARWQAEVDQIPKYRAAISSLAEGLEVPAEEMASQFALAIQAQEAQSGVSVTGNSRTTTRTNEFFLELTQSIGVQSGEPQLVDFLYNLGAGSSLIRVRGLTLRPDQQRQKLSANVTLVASYQKNPPKKPAAAGQPAAAEPPPLPPKTVKASLLILLLTGFGLEAQVPAGPPLPSVPAGSAPNANAISNRAEMRRLARQRALAGFTNAPVLSPSSGTPSAGTNALRRQPGLPAASAAFPPQPAPVQPVASTPRPAGTNAPGEELLEEGMINFRGADLNQVLEIYSMLVNRTVLRQATLPAAPIVLKTQGQLTKREGIQALDAVLALNGMTMVNVGEKFVKAVAEAQGNTAGAPFNTNSAASLPEMGQYVTHILQLKYAKPSELVPVLQGFVKIPNAILPIEGCQILVLRDYAENVKRMLELVSKIDVAIPSEYVQEVIPIKYGKAADIAGAIEQFEQRGRRGERGRRDDEPESDGIADERDEPDGHRHHWRVSGDDDAGMVTPPGSAGRPG